MSPAILAAMPSVVRLVGGRWTTLGHYDGPVWAEGEGEFILHCEPWMRESPSRAHFLAKTLSKVAVEMALSVLAYNLTRVMNIVGIKPLVTVIGA